MVCRSCEGLWKITKIQGKCLLSAYSLGGGNQYVFIQAGIIDELLSTGLCPGFHNYSCSFFLS